MQAAALGAGRWESPNAPPPPPRGLGVDSKPELQRVLEHRRRNQLIKKKKEELEAKRLQCPFEQELLRRQQRLNQVGGAPSPSFLQDYLLGQGGAWPAVTADEEAEPDEDWTQGPPLACVLTRLLPSLCDLGSEREHTGPVFSLAPSIAC